MGDEIKIRERYLSCYQVMKREITTIEVIDRDKLKLIKIVGNRLIHFGKERMIYLTECGRIFCTTREYKYPEKPIYGDEGFFIQVDIFKDIRDVCVVQFNCWMVLFNNDNLVKFRVTCTEQFKKDHHYEVRSLGKISRITDILHLRYKPSRYYMVALDRDNHMVTIHTHLLKWKSDPNSDELSKIESGKIEELDLNICNDGKEIPTSRKVLKSAIISENKIYYIDEIPTITSPYLLELDPDINDKTKFAVPVDKHPSFHSSTKVSTPQLEIRDAVRYGLTSFIITEDGDFYAKHYMSDSAIKIDLGLKLSEFIWIKKENIYFTDIKGKVYHYHLQAYKLTEFKPLMK